MVCEASLQPADGETALLVACVDALLLCCQSEKAEKIVEKAIGKAMPLKETGIILPARVIFIGRHVHRGLDDDCHWCRS
jgi:hypothetical protein